MIILYYSGSESWNVNLKVRVEYWTIVMYVVTMEIDLSDKSPREILETMMFGGT